MTYFFLQAYEHIQNRAVRLAVLCAFVITFFGLPTLGNHINNPSLAKLDIVDYIGNNIDEMINDAEQARYQAYLARTKQTHIAKDEKVILTEENTALWNVEQMFKNVFGPGY